MQSVGHPSFCKDQKRKLLRHRHFCNEFAANNRPRDKEMTLFANPTFRVLDIILLWFVLSCMGSFSSIQYSECCTHSISRVKMNWIPSPTALYLSLYCKGWYWMICLSSLEASSYLWTISADCLSLESSRIPYLFHPALHSAQTERMVTYIQFDKISISLSPPP